MARVRIHDFGLLTSRIGGYRERPYRDMVKALVEDPESVVVEEVDEGDSTTYEVTVNPDDIGKVIGKQGRVANALRTVAKAAALKAHKNVYVKIMP